jgi:hypothetical protein
VPTTTWDQPAWDHIEAAAPGLPRLIATLQATVAACDAAIGLGDATPAIDPYAGWASSHGTLAGLTVAAATEPPPAPDNLETPPDDDAAAAAVDQLYRTAADQVLALITELADQLRAVDYDQREYLTYHGRPARPLLQALNAAMLELAITYRQTFDRPW